MIIATMNTNKESANTLRSKHFFFWQMDETSVDADALILPLHGSMSGDEQRLIFQPPYGGKR